MSVGRFQGDAIKAAAAVAAAAAAGRRAAGPRRTKGCLEEVDGLEKATSSHLSFVFLLSESFSGGPLFGDGIIKSDRLASSRAFMASVSISTVVHGRLPCPFRITMMLPRGILKNASAAENARRRRRRRLKGALSHLAGCGEGRGPTLEDIPPVGSATGCAEPVQNSNNPALRLALVPNEIKP